MSPTRLLKNKFLVTGLLVFFHLILISYQIPLGSRQTLLEKILFRLFSPVQKVTVESYRLVASSWNSLRYQRQLQKENLELAREIFFLRQSNQLLKEKLKLLLNKSELEANLRLIAESVIPARTIGFDTSNYYRSVIINRGTADGLERNLPVCDKYGNLIGRTAEPLGAHEARVLLITSEESGVAVISNSDRMIGILSGEGQGSCLVKYILTSSPAGIEGDELQTSGFDRVYPPGLKIGRIIQVSQTKGIFKKIVVRPYFDIKDLRLVAVLKNSEKILR